MQFEIELGPTSKRPKGNTRTTGKEQYYTPEELASSIVESVTDLVPDFRERTMIEPAGGTGAFIKAAELAGISDIISFDIEPLHERVQLGDFLLQDLKVTGAITISNPPFGRNNALSIPFFNHAAKYSDLIVFIVPQSWRKWTVMNKLDRNFQLIKDVDLTVDYVDDQGVLLHKKNGLRTCIQYWQRSDQARAKIGVKNNGFIEKCGPDEADVSLTIFGRGCGRVKLEFPRRPNTTQMFLRLHHPRALEALQNVDFSQFFMRTAYTEALSIQEINYLLNEYILGDPCLLRPASEGDIGATLF
jgi:predicted RNA methylase